MKQCFSAVTSYVVVVVVISGWSTPVSAQLTQATLNGHSTYDKPLYLAGEFLTVEAPDNGALRDFRVPAHDGKVRVGHLNYLADSHMLGSNEKNARMRGMFIQKSAFQLYIDLLALGENQDILTEENLNQLYTSARGAGTSKPGAAGWHDLLIHSGRGGLSDSAYRDVFCSDAVPCPVDVYFGPRPYHIGNRRRGEARLVWGNGENEFRFRAAYQKFVSQYAQSLIQWGASLSRDVVSVGSTRMPRYDFDKGAYLFRLSVGNIAALPEERSLEYRSDSYDVDIGLNSGGTREISTMLLTWKLNAADAEALRNQVTERRQNHFFVKSQGQLAFRSIDRVAMQSPLALEESYIVNFTGDRVTLYWDAELTDRIGEFMMPK